MKTANEVLFQSLVDRWTYRAKSKVWEASVHELSVSGAHPAGALVCSFASDHLRTVTYDRHEDTLLIERFSNRKPRDGRRERDEPVFSCKLSFAGVLWWCQGRAIADDLLWILGAMHALAATVARTEAI